MSNYFDHLLLLLSIRYGDGAGRPNTVKAPVTLSRNETEPAGITIFKIRDTFGRDSHLLKKKLGMPFEYYEFTANPHRMILAHSECISSRMQLQSSWKTVGIFRMLL